MAQLAATGFSAQTRRHCCAAGRLVRHRARRAAAGAAPRAGRAHDHAGGTLFYLLAGTWLAPQLWLDPLGPLTKIVPMLVGTALTLAIMDER